MGPLLLRFRGSLFYVVERSQTTAIPDVDCHKDLHGSVQKVCSLKKQGEQLTGIRLLGYLVWIMAVP